MPCTSVHNVLNDSHFCAQVEFEELVGAEDHRGKQMTCTNVHNVLNAGLGTPFFSVQNVPFFFVLKRERYVLFRSFLEFIETQKERKERNVLLQRTEKNGKNAPFFLKERKRTRERFVLLQKERENVPFFF